MVEPIVFYIGIDWLCFFFFCGLDDGRSGLHPSCVVASVSLVVYFWFVVSLSYAWFLFWASHLIEYLL